MIFYFIYFDRNCNFINQFKKPCLARTLERIEWRIFPTQTWSRLDLKAAFAKLCAAVLVLLRTWLTSLDWNSCNRVRVSSITFPYELQLGDSVRRAEITVSESPSKTTHRKSNSLHRVTALLAAIASTVVESVMKGMTSTSAANTHPSLLRTTTPIPISFVSFAKAQSRLHLIHPVGGLHVPFSKWVAGGGYISVSP